MQMGAAGAAGGGNPRCNEFAGNGGNGAANSITGCAVTYAGGGGGALSGCNPSTGAFGAAGPGGGGQG